MSSLEFSLHIKFQIIKLFKKFFEFFIFFVFLISSIIMVDSIHHVQKHKILQLNKIR